MDTSFFKLLYGLHCLIVLCLVHISAALPLKVVIKIQKDNGHQFAMLLDNSCMPKPIECIESIVAKKLQSSSSRAAFFIQNVAALHALDTVSCKSIFFHYICKVMPFSEVRLQKPKSKTNNSFESQVMIEFRDNAKLTESCYRGYIEKAKERINRSALENISFF